MLDDSVNVVEKLIDELPTTLSDLVDVLPSSGSKKGYGIKRCTLLRLRAKKFYIEVLFYNLSLYIRIFAEKLYFG